MHIDKEKIEKAIRLFLEGIGEDPDREGLKDTPKRVSKMWEEFKAHEEFNMTVFEDIGNYNEMVVVKDIQFYSLCEHHLLPFFGKAHIAYIPNEKVCGLSKLVRIVNKFAYRPQVQERLTAEIAEFLEKELNPKGVAVVLEAEHLCYSSDTQILTQRGWKLFKELKPDDQVAQVNSHTLKISFTIPEAYIKYPFKGMMINFKGKSIDLLVSPDHKTLFSTQENYQKDQRWNISQAYKIKELPNLILPQSGYTQSEDIDYIELEENIPHSSLKTKINTKIKADLFFKFLGIYLSTGKIHAKKLKIYLSQKDSISTVEKVLQELPFDYTKKLHQDKTIEYTIDFEPLVNFVKDTDISLWLIKASQRQKKIFLAYLLLKAKQNKDEYYFVSSSKKLLDTIQAVYATIGIPSTLSKHKDNEFKLTINTQQENYSLVEEIVDVPYNDYIYSVTVPEGFLLIRRNGKISISGNCMSMRGVKNPTSYTVTSKLIGVFMENQKTREEFLNLINSK